MTEFWVRFLCDTFLGVNLHLKKPIYWVKLKVDSKGFNKATLHKPTRELRLKLTLRPQWDIGLVLPWLAIILADRLQKLLVMVSIGLGQRVGHGFGDRDSWNIRPNHWGRGWRHSIEVHDRRIASVENEKKNYVRPILHKKSQAVGKRPSLVDPVHNSHRERKAYDFGWILEFYWVLRVGRTQFGIYSGYF